MILWFVPRSKCFCCCVGRERSPSRTSAAQRQAYFPSGLTKMDPQEEQGSCERCPGPILSSTCLIRVRVENCQKPVVNFFDWLGERGILIKAMRVPMKPKDRMLVTSSERYHAMSISPFCSFKRPILPVNQPLSCASTIPKLLVLNPRIPQRSAKTNKALCRVIHRHQPSLGAY